MQPTARLLATLLLFGSLALRLEAQSTAFAYKGQLSDGAKPANGYYALQFRLVDAETDGNYLGPTLALPPVMVSNGLFTVTLDFGAMVFDGSARWLEMGVRTNGAASYTLLAPRQQVMATPYAIYAGNAAGVSGTVSASQVTGVLSGVQLPGSVVTNGSSGVTLSGTFSGNGLGITNLSGAGLTGPIPDTSLNAALLYAAYNNSLSNRAFARDMAAAYPAPKLKISSWLAGGGGGGGTWPNNYENWAVTNALWLNTNGYTRLLPVQIHLDEGWEASGRDGNGNISWNPARFPHGLPWLVQVLATNNCILSVYLPLGGGCLGGQGTDVQHEFQDVVNVVSWGVSGIDQDFCNGAASQAATYFHSTEDFLKYEIATANAAFSAATTADHQSMFRSAPANRPFLQTVLFDTSFRDCAPLEAKMGVNVACLAGQDFNGTQANDIWNLRYMQYNGWIAGPGTVLNGGGCYGEFTPFDFALTAEGPFSATIGYIRGSTATSASTWTNNLDWLSAWQDPAMLPCKLVSSNNLFEVYNRPMGGLYTQDKLVLISNLGASAVPYTVTAASLGLSPSLTYSAWDLWNKTNVLFTGSFSTTVGPSSFVQFRINLPINGFTGLINAGGTLLGVTNGLIMSHTP